MSTYRRFTELPLWNEAVEFAAEVYRFCENSSLKTDYRMKDQLRSAASSISNNIAEGFEYDSTVSFIRFLTYAKGSSAEVYNQFTILHRADMITQNDYELFGHKAMILNRSIGGLLKYLKTKSVNK